MIVYMAIKRLPFIFGFSNVITGYPYSYLKLFHADPSLLPSDQAEHLLPIDIAYFIHMHCVCELCGSNISRDLHCLRCPSSEHPDYQIQALFLDKHNDEMAKLLRRNHARSQGKKKREKRLSAPGKHSQSEIQTLFNLQEEMCFYCGESLVNQAGNTDYHRDHYEPLAYGGTNDISNIVLACPACNLSKADQPPESFLRGKLSGKDMHLRNKVMSIRKKVRVFHTKQSK